MEWKQPVKLTSLTLAELLNCNEQGDSQIMLKIPDYQRIYCWEEKHVLRLLHDITSYANNEYHMGTVVLHKKKRDDNTSIHEIVDGQQRLVTLTLILLELGTEVTFSNEKILTADAQSFVAYNKWLISKFLDPQKVSAEQTLKNLKFSALILETTTLDLAYTFFTSNANRGKPLSDYDLLKSHHLRYIPMPQQAQHAAERWDNLIRQNENGSQEKALARTFEVCLFRLRKWMRKKSWDDNEKRKIKLHFEASPIIPEIPAFGEQFYFNESIQGGGYFFAFAERYVFQYNDFAQTKPYQSLHQYLSKENHWWYRDIIEALSFAYYLKFGNQYLPDIVMLIAKIIAHHRYISERAYPNSIFKYVNETEVVMMIDQATSPTFFIAEIKSSIDHLQEVPQITGTRKRFRENIEEIEKELKSISEIKNGL